MALKPVRFDFDAARRAYRRELAPLSFRFEGTDFTVLNEPSLGDTLDLYDAPEFRPGENDLETIRTLAAFIRRMIVPTQREAWDAKLYNLPSSEAPAVVALAAWITEQVTGFPTMPPASSSAGRRTRGASSKRRTDGTAA